MSQPELLAVMIPGPNGTRRVGAIVGTLSEARGFARGYGHGPGRGPIGIRSVDWKLDPADEEEDLLLADGEL